MTWRMTCMLLIVTVGCSAGCRRRGNDAGPGATSTVPNSESEAASPNESGRMDRAKADGASAGSQAAARDGATGLSKGTTPTVAAETTEPAAKPDDKPLPEDAELLKQLAELGSDADIERRAATEALVALGSSVMPGVLRALRGGAVAEQRGAARFLVGRVGPRDSSSVTALIEALGAEDATLRHTALQAVERLTEQQRHRSLPALMTMAKDTREEDAYRIRATRGIGNLGPVAQATLPELVQLARKSESLNLRRSAFFAIAKVGAPADAEDFFLEELADNTTPELRRLAAKWLATVAHSDRCLSGLVRAFDDGEKSIRRTASESLLAIGKPAVPALIKALESPSVQVRRYATFTLGKLGPLASAAIPALEKCSDDPDEEIRKLSAAALRLIRRQ